MTGRRNRRLFGSATRAALLVAVVAAAAILAVLGLAVGSNWVATAGLGAAIVGAAAFAFHLIVTERRRHEVAEEELTAQSSFLESLIESMGSIAATLDPDEVLERTRHEAKRLFGAKATLLGPGEAAGEGVVVLPLRIRGEEIGSLQLVRSRVLDREELARATLLADFASRAVENARLLAEATVREVERGRLSDQLIIAEQEERRRLALFLHDGPMQSLSGISLMLDAVIDSLESNRLDEASGVLRSALERHRDTIRSLRDLSFNIEPVVLRDQGFGPAVRAFAEQVGLSNRIQVDLDVEAADGLTENARVAIYQIVRDVVNQALRRKPTRIGISVAEKDDGTVETVISDDGAGERRRSSFEDIEERARTLSGELTVEAREDGRTAVRVVLPPYVAHR
ncbi:MAG TPA: histidine kinase [Gaiellaceae bacterium]|jgi:signal transduction histidine kinase|nr:histidine kinase [Gaiellaceae bacterium]